MNKAIRHIFLIGMMGSGKSTVGPLLAGMLGYVFIDLDSRIEERSGKRIADIFAEEGEAAFRELETATAKDLDLSKPVVLAAGGGFPSREANRIWMREHGEIIWLKASVATILERVKHEDRPLLPKPVNPERIETILKDRISFYEAADFQIDTEHRDPKAIAKRIGEWISCKRP